jgi:TolB-like protein/DNA-binding SARP family transcriptional activator
MFKLHTFGGLSLTLDGQPCERSLIQRRQLALLAALAAAGQSGLSRDKLVGLMWPDRANDRARNLLDQALYAARRVCGQSVFVTTQTALVLNPAVVESDVGEFSDAITRGDPAAAAAIYSGPFLDGLLLADAADFERWASLERTRYAREYQECLESLAATAEGREQWHEAGRWWRRAADADPFSGRAARGLIESLARSGDRAGALEFARVHAALVRQELGAEVDPPIAALVTQLRAGELPPASRRAPSQPSTGDDEGHAASLAARQGTTTKLSSASESFSPRADEPPREAAVSRSVAVAATAVRDAELEPRAALAAPAVTSRGGRFQPARWIPLAAIGLAVLAALGAGVVWWRSHRAAVDDASIPQPPSIAVLPFRNMGTSQADEYFSDGMTEEIIAELSRLRGVRVVARTSSFAFKGKPMDVREIGSALNVTHVLEGTVRRVGSTPGARGPRLRVTAELVDASTGFQVWAEQFDRPAGDALAIQDEISASIMQSLQREFASELPPHGGHAPPSAATYDLYLRGRYAWHQRTSEALHLAVDLFSRAIRSDPDYAAAYSGLGATYAVLPLYDPHAGVTEMYALAQDAASRALSLDSTLSEPFAVIGLVSARRYEWRVAERSYRLALARNPNDATAHQWFGKALAHQGRFVEAESEMRRALDLDPLSAVTRYNLGQVLYGQGRFDDAARELNQALKTAPTFRAAHSTLGYVRMSQGRRADALREFQLAAGPARGRANSDVAVLAYGFASTGEPDSAVRLLEAALDGRASDPATAAATSAADIALAYMALGERDSAFAWLERARVEHDSDLQAFVASPILEPLRSDARYAELRSKMNLP